MGSPRASCGSHPSPRHWQRDRRPPQRRSGRRLNAPAQSLCPPETQLGEGTGLGRLPAEPAQFFKPAAAALAIAGGAGNPGLAQQLPSETAPGGALNRTLTGNVNDPGNAVVCHGERWGSAIGSRFRRQGRPAAPSRRGGGPAALTRRGALRRQSRKRGCQLRFIKHVRSPAPVAVGRILIGRWPNVDLPNLGGREGCNPMRRFRHRIPAATRVRREKTSCFSVY